MKLESLKARVLQFLESERKSLQPHPEMVLVEKLVATACNEDSLTREAVSRCYYSTLSNPPNEKPSTSELWVDEIWNRCKEIPPENFRAAKGKRLKLAELGHAIFM